MAMLQPGEWGTLPGAPVQRRLVQRLGEMGVDMLRVGGTYVKTDTEMDGTTLGAYRWKTMRGAASVEALDGLTGVGI